MLVDVAARCGCFSSTCVGRGRTGRAVESTVQVHFSVLFPYCGVFTIQWHALGREEQAKYYELARRERQLHMQLYPDWSSRANTQRGKKRKRKQETTDGGTAFHSVDERPSPPLRSRCLRPGPLRPIPVSVSHEVGHDANTCPGAADVPPRCDASIGSLKK